MQFGPQVLLLPWTASAADHMDRRRFLFVRRPFWVFARWDALSSSSADEVSDYTEGSNPKGRKGEARSVHVDDPCLQRLERQTCSWGIY